MRRILHRKTCLIFLLGLLLILLLQFWFPASTTSAAIDTFSVSSQGKKAIYSLLQQRGLYTIRSTDSLEAVLDEELSWDYDNALVLLGPQQSPSDSEWHEILRWVSQGGTLIYAAKLSPETVTIPELNVGIKPLFESSPFEPASSGMKMFPFLEISLDASGKVAWPIRSEITLPDSLKEGSTPLVQSGESLQAVHIPYAEGKVILVATDTIFSNLSLLNEANAVLVFRLFEEAELTEYGAYWFDEYLNSSAVPKVFGVLFGSSFRPLTLLLLMILWLYLWSDWFRFGPYLPATESRRRSIVAHSNNLGTLHHKHRLGAVAVTGYWKQFQTELNWRVHKRHQDQLFRRLAIRTGRPVEEIKTLIQQADSCQANSSMTRGAATQLVEKLAHLRQQLNSSS